MNFLPAEKTYYWWLDEVHKEHEIGKKSNKNTLHFVDLGKTMHREGPGILLLRKRG